MQPSSFLRSGRRYEVVRQGEFAVVVDASRRAKVVMRRVAADEPASPLHRSGWAHVNAHAHPGLFRAAADATPVDPPAAL